MNDFPAFAEAEFKAQALRNAQALLQVECDKLTAMLVAKGYPGNTACIWIGWERGAHVYIKSDYKAVAPDLPYRDDCDDVAEAIGKARDAIAALHNPDDYAAYFAWPVSQAAE